MSLLDNNIDIKVVTLGAGQAVGRSCIIINFHGKKIMLDCGMHMGKEGAERFPDFSFISERGKANEEIDLAIVSHFHLDHCGALPFFTEKVGYSGPLYMTPPTKAICPLLLEDFRKIATKGLKEDEEFFTAADIAACMNKVTTVELEEEIFIEPGFSIIPYYAGHVLGAAMFLIKINNHSVLYTGDYNMTADRHLGGAWIDRVRPDVLITETTYGNTIRDSKRVRERDFLREVHEVVDNGGRVLIPVFALGRAQELCVLLETYWRRMGLTVPINFSTGLTDKANEYYKKYTNWCNTRIRNTAHHSNPFEFNCIGAFTRGQLRNPGPMVILCTPGMLHAGTSLDVFKALCQDEKNMIVIPGYCVEGTVGNKILKGEKKVAIDGQNYDVKMKVRHMSFSAHVDHKGIMQLLRQVKPLSVLLVHGNLEKMKQLRTVINMEFPSLNVMFPPDRKQVSFKPPSRINIKVSSQVLKNQIVARDPLKLPPNNRKTAKYAVKGVLFETNNGLELVSDAEAADRLNHEIPKNISHFPIFVSWSRAFSVLSSLPVSYISVPPPQIPEVPQEPQQGVNSPTRLNLKRTGSIILPSQPLSSLAETTLVGPPLSTPSSPSLPQLSVESASNEQIMPNEFIVDTLFRLIIGELSRWTHNETVAASSDCITLGGASLTITPNGLEASYAPQEEMEGSQLIIAARRVLSLYHIDP